MSLATELKDKEFLLLTTFKKGGQSVGTPMWFALDEEKAYMSTREGSWKVRRLRNNSRATVTWCDGWGRHHGEMIEAEARIVEDPEEKELARRLLQTKYGLKKRLLDLGMRFAKDKTEAIICVRAKS